MKRIVYFVLADIIRNRIVVAYAVLLAVCSWTVFGLEDSSSKAVLTLLSLVLLMVPLIAILFSTIYLYKSAEFIELLLSQPIRRRRIWVSLFAGLSISLTAAYLLAAGPPLLLFADTGVALLLLAAGSLLTVIFVALAFLAAILSRDKAKGIGIAVMLWFWFALLFDGLVLFLLFQLSDYPIEKPMVLLAATSPLDLARILVLLQIDQAAMLGYTGAIFRNYFGTALGMTISFLILALWSVLPFLWSLRIFRKKDL